MIPCTCNLLNFLEIMNSKFILREGRKGLVMIRGRGTFFETGRAEELRGAFAEEARLTVH